MVTRPSVCRNSALNRRWALGFAYLPAGLDLGCRGTHPTRRGQIRLSESLIESLRAYGPSPIGLAFRAPLIRYQWLLKCSTGS
jgi:hypothetical protein